MNFQPILTADPVIVVHIICGVTALIVGPIALYGKRRGALHQARRLSLGLFYAPLCGDFVFHRRLGSLRRLWPDSFAIIFCNLVSFRGDAADLLGQ